MRNILIFGTVFLLFVSFGYASILTTDLITYLAFDTNVDDSTGNYSYTPTNPLYDIVDFMDGNASWNGTSGTGRFAVSSTNVIISASSNWSVGCWVKSGSAKEETILGFDGSLQIIGNFNDANAFLSFNPNNGGSCGDVANTSSTYADNDWHFVTGVKEDNTQKIYIDGDLHGSESGCSFVTTINAATWWGTKNVAPTYRDWGGSLDECMLFSIALQSSDITLLYNSGVGLFYPFTATEADSNTINLSSPLPTNNAEFNTQLLNFNLTANASNQFNCSLYINSTLNQTQNEFSLGLNVAIDFNISFASTEQSHYNYIIGCWDGLNDTNTSSSIFFIDNVPPDLTIDSSLISNLSIIYGENNFVGNINCTDSNLWGMNITLDDTYIIFNKTNIDGNSYNYNMNFDPNFYSLSVGSHIISAECSDSHTIGLIPDYSYYKNPISKSITYDFEGDWIKIKPLNKGLFSGFDTWKNEDRYVFEFERDAIGKFIYGTDLEFEVSSSRKLDIVNHGYVGHIISYDLKKWIDFETNNKNAVVTTERIDDKKINVLIKGIEEDLITFNSIGGLNVINKNFTFYFGNTTETYVEPVIETEASNFTLNFTRNDSFVSDINAIFNLNGTPYTPTKITSSDSIYFVKETPSGLLDAGVNFTNLSFFWDYNITNVGAGNNITNTTDTTNQKTYKMIVGNCIDGGISNETAAINFTVNDHTSGDAAFVNATGSFTVWKGSNTLTRIYGLGWSNVANFQLCLYPAFASLTTDYTLTYTGYGDTNNRIQTGDTIDNSTDQVTLYIFKDGEDISINVVDENDNGLEGYEVEAYQYDIGNSSYTLVGEETTDPDGLAVMRLYRDAENLYQFRVYDLSSGPVFNSSTFKLYKTEYTFRIVIVPSPESELINLQNLDYSLNSEQSDSYFDLRWDDSLTSLISNMNLIVKRVNATGELELYSTTSSNATGTFHYNITETYGTYIAYAYATAAGDGNTYLLDTATIDLREEWDLFKKDALLAAFLFNGVLIFVGLAISAEIGLVLAILGIVVFYLLGFVAVSLSGVIALIVSIIAIIVKVSKE